MILHITISIITIITINNKFSEMDILQPESHPCRIESIATPNLPAKIIPANIRS